MKTYASHESLETTSVSEIESIMHSMDEFRVMSQSIALVMLMLHISYIISSESSSISIPNVITSGGLPSNANMSNASSTGVSLLNGKLTLDSTHTDFVYGLFPYNAFNTSNPNMGSFDTAFNFTTKTSSGALGFIIIDPDSEPTMGSSSSK